MTTTTKDIETTRTDGPDEPTEVPRRGWWAVLKRTVKEFQEDNLTDWAAALTYYGVLALFPALLALVSIVGLAGKDATDTLVENVSAVTSGPAEEVIRGAITNLSRSGGTAGVTFVVGLLLALWSASGYIGAFMRASNAIYEVEEGRPFWKLRPIQMGMTLTMLLLVALAVIGIVVTGPLAKGVGDTLGVGDTAVTVWNYAKWPVILAVIMTCFAFLYHLAPNVKQPGFRWITPGAVVGVILWIVASVAFAFYVANFANYNKTYGTLGGMIAFLVWLWVSNIAVLLGAELNAELERQRELESGVPGADRELRLEPRDPPKRDDG